MNLSIGAQGRGREARACGRIGGATLWFWICCRDGRHGLPDGGHFRLTVPELWANSRELGFGTGRLAPGHGDPPRRGARVDLLGGWGGAECK